MSNLIASIDQSLQNKTPSHKCLCALCLWLWQQISPLTSAETAALVINRDTVWEREHIAPVALEAYSVNYKECFPARRRHLSSREKRRAFLPSVLFREVRPLCQTLWMRATWHTSCRYYLTPLSLWMASVWREVNSAHDYASCPNSRTLICPSETL